MQDPRPPPAAGLPAPAAELDLAAQAQMVQSLQRELAAQSGHAVKLVETHISYVLLCGPHAYKIKKALRNSFLDQSTLVLRQQACQAELRLNRRLAAELYLGVVPIAGPASQARMGGQGDTIDFAVKMRAFAQEGLWDGLSARGELGAAQVDGLVHLLAAFHAAAAVADPQGPFGLPAQVRAPLRESLADLEAGLSAGADHACLKQLTDWEAAAFKRLQPVMARRLAQGAVRECHGDLHLGNVTTIDGRTTVFDCIEFNDGFRWIDVISEVAFMAMDLHAHGLPLLAHRFVNAYLEASGDYGGVEVLSYYLVHRALVRAKVHLLRARQCEPLDAAGAVTERAGASRYIDLALRFCQQQGATPVLMLTHGFSGSGKSTAALDLVGAVGAIRIRADVERKRLAGLRPLDHRSTEREPGLYAADMTTATYARLLQLAAPVLSARFAVILDATYLQRAQRVAAWQFAARRDVACVILDFDLAPEVLQQRLRERAAQGLDPSDADEAVLAAQMQAAEPLQEDELEHVFRCPALAPSEGAWAPLLARLASLRATGVTRSSPA